MSETLRLDRPDGATVTRYRLGSGIAPILVLHATISSSIQLWRLASTLVEPRDLRAILVDRRGSGESRLAPVQVATEGATPVGVDVADHVGDLVAVLDAEEVDQTLVFGHSFGGVVGLELAARHPERVAGLVVYEPPYGPFAPEAMQPWFAATTEETFAASRTGGPAAAAEAFMRRVAGPEAWDGLSERAREFIAAQGSGAVADVSLSGLAPDGLGRIDAAVGILTGGASEPVYGEIADELLARLRYPRSVTLHGLRHTAPITDGATVAAAIREMLVTFGALPPR